MGRTEQRTRRKQLLLNCLGGICVDCGISEKLQFDHVIPEEYSFKIGSNLMMKLEKLLPEVQKCQLLCFECHWKKSRTETHYGPVPEHGTVTKYINRGCRCSLCKKAWTDYFSPRKARYLLNKKISIK